MAKRTEPKAAKKYRYPADPDRASPYEKRHRIVRSESSARTHPIMAVEHLLAKMLAADRDMANLRGSDHFEPAQTAFASYVDMAMESLVLAQVQLGDTGHPLACVRQLTNRLLQADKLLATAHARGPGQGGVVAVSLSALIIACLSRLAEIRQRLAEKTYRPLEISDPTLSIEDYQPMQQVGED